MLFFVLRSKGAILAASRFAILLLSGIVAGCSPSDLPPVAAVQGQVIYQGEPVEGATVTFRPREGGKPATGMTDAQGRFRLSTFSEHDGAIVGEHAVTVAKFHVGDEEVFMEMEDVPEVLPDVEVRAELPERYGRPDTSELQYTVEQRVQNEFTIELED